jgi:hypothetical protein
MSLQTCQPGDNQGFPIKISQKLSDVWPSSTRGSTAADIQKELKALTAPTDLSVSWGPPAQSAQISVISTSTLCQIRGFDTVSDSTTMTYGSATYKCSSVMSIVKNQHAFLTGTKVTDYEVILAFQIKNKSDHPSSPDIILVTRPLIFGSWNTDPFWSNVNTAMIKGTRQSCVVDLSTLFAYNSSAMMPMIAYETCLPVKLINYKSSPSAIGSLKIRVNAITQPIYVVADESGLGQCSSISRYTLITEPKNPVDLFEGASANTKLQFKDGLGPGGFPVGITTNLIPMAASSIIGSFETILDTIIILVPESFLGKSLSELSDIKTPAPAPKKKRALKCYRINSEKDIKNGEILVDPETGESLKSTLDKEAKDSIGGDLSLLESSSGLMPGDVENIIFIILTSILSIGLFGYLVYIYNMVVTENEYAYHNLAFFVFLVISLISFAIVFTKT